MQQVGGSLPATPAPTVRRATCPARFPDWVAWVAPGLPLAPAPALAAPPLVGRAGCPCLGGLWTLWKRGLCSSVLAPARICLPPSSFPHYFAVQADAGRGAGARPAAAADDGAPHPAPGARAGRWQATGYHGRASPLPLCLRAPCLCLAPCGKAPPCPWDQPWVAVLQNLGRPLDRVPCPALQYAPVQQYLDGLTTPGCGGESRGEGRVLRPHRRATDWPGAAATLAACLIAAWCSPALCPSAPSPALSPAHTRPHAARTGSRRRSV